MNGLSAGLQSIAPLAMAALVLTALALLFHKDRSVWLIVAIIGEIIGLLFRIALFVVPELPRSAPIFFSLWTLSSFVFAAGLLGYAIERHQQR